MVVIDRFHCSWCWTTASIRQSDINPHLTVAVKADIPQSPRICPENGNAVRRATFHKYSTDTKHWVHTLGHSPAMCGKVIPGLHGFVESEPCYSSQHQTFILYILVKPMAANKSQDCRFVDSWRIPVTSPRLQPLGHFRYVNEQLDLLCDMDNRWKNTSLIQIPHKINKSNGFVFPSLQQSLTIHCATFYDTVNNLMKRNGLTLFFLHFKHNRSVKRSSFIATNKG